MYKSQIRDSEINQLLQKVSRQNYDKYLYKIHLTNVRGFHDQTVVFDFPVTAIVGPNGGGKTTVLGAAGILYDDIKPRQFFARSRLFDTDMKDWKIECEVVDKGINPRQLIKRSATFKSKKWSRNAFERKVSIFGISRTLPAVERTEMLKFAKTNYKISLDNLSQIETEITPRISRVLGKDVKKFQILYKQNNEIDLLAGNIGDINYSEFHFGAGESSVIKMITLIESIDDNSLILIEEIENGLHPIATRLLVEYLIDAAIRKKIQVIFTTHSDYATDPLPHQAVWSALDNKVYQGKLSVESLRYITGEIDTELIIYVEDTFAKIWVQTIISQKKSYDYDSIEIHAMGGDGTAVKMNKNHNDDPSRRSDSICFIDGDSQQNNNDSEHIYRLPGQMPELYIFDKVMEQWSGFGMKLNTMLLQRFEDADSTRNILNEAQRTTRDMHNIFNIIAEKLLLTHETVIQAFIAIWCQAYSGEVDSVHEVIERYMPARRAESTEELIYN